MRPMTPTVWTPRRKWLGNLVPVLFWLPLIVAGVWVMAARQEIVGLGLWLLIGGTALGWLAVNLFGFWDNARMRRQLTLIMQAKGEPVAAAPFVGFATPKYSSMLDPHEEVGFLMLLPDRLRFLSEERVLEVPKEQIQSVRFRANVHTLIGLGRWISIEGTSDGKPIRLLIEPRERRTLLSNLSYGKSLRQKISRWLKEGERDG